MMIVGSVSRAMFSYLTTRDQNLMRRLNGWRPPRWVRVWMVLASRLGDGWLWWAVGLVLLVFGGPGRFKAVGAALILAALAVGLFLRIQKLVNRTRAPAISPH